MKSVPRFFRGLHRIAMRVALEEIESADDTRRERRVEVFSTLAEVAPPPFSQKRHDPKVQVVESFRPLQPGRVDFFVGGQPGVL